MFQSIEDQFTTGSNHDNTSCSAHYHVPLAGPRVITRALRPTSSPRSLWRRPTVGTLHPHRTLTKSADPTTSKGERITRLEEILTVRDIHLVELQRKTVQLEEQHSLLENQYSWTRADLAIHKSLLSVLFVTLGQPTYGGSWWEEAGEVEEEDREAEMWFELMPSVWD